MLAYLKAYKEVLTDINLYREHNKCRGTPANKLDSPSQTPRMQAVTAGGMSTIPLREDI